jgi:inner membrane protein
VLYSYSKRKAGTTMSVGSNIKNSVIFKIIFIGVITIVLLIPISMIKKLVTEREARRDSAIFEVSDKWGRTQIITGPVLSVPFYIYWKDEKNIPRSSLEIAQFFPEILEITADIVPEIRSRGIFDVVLYRSALRIKGEFPPLKFDELKIAEKDIVFDDIYLSLGIPDMRGIKDNPILVWNQSHHNFMPGVPDPYLFSSGMHVKIPDMGRHYKRNNKFDLQLTLNGSEVLQFIPVGKETRVSLDSSWPSPSFIGSYLPVSHEVTNAGFQAQWTVSYFGRGYQQYWKSNKVDYAVLKDSILNSSFGVKLLLMVDHYHKTLRSVKYAVLFILLTFVAFFLFEILSKMKVHPFQYLLIGFAMSIFYLLLLSISEHLDFSFTYIIASVATIALITGYSSWILRQKKKSLVVAFLLILLYVFLYILLQIEDYALLVGSLALFIVLGIVMIVTRKVDWYSIKLNRGDNG